MTKSEATAQEVAAWMFQKLRQQRELNQDDVVDYVARIFGSQFTYSNELGNPAIKKMVLDAFKKLTGNDVVWERARRLWRFRERHDLPGRMQP